MSATLYYAALVLHIAGITLMAGTAFIDFITFRAFYKAYTSDTVKGAVLENYLYKLLRFIEIGMVLILISGIIMMVKLHEVWGAQLWFRIKMGLLLLVAFNGLGLRRMLGKRLKKIVQYGTSIDEVKRNFTIVQLLQLLLFIVIFTLSVFKFN